MTVTTLTTGRPGTRPPGVAAGAVARLGPLACCPRCGGLLDGGPVAYHCAACGRGVMAADIDIDYHPPAPGGGAGSATGGGL